MGLDGRRRRIALLGFIVAGMGCLALALLQLFEPFIFADRALPARLVAAASWGVLALLFGALGWWLLRSPPA